MELAIKIRESSAERLREEAKQLGVSPETLAAAALDDVLNASDPEFRAAAQRVLEANQELYKRLAQ
jgi:hypothetical protein